MAETDDRRTARWRERVAVAAMSFFPLLVGVGFFAPGWVHVLAVAQVSAAPEREPIVDRVGPFARRPIPAPHELFGSSDPQLLDLAELYADVGVEPYVPVEPDEGGTPEPTPVPKLASGFPRNGGDSIVVAELGTVPEPVAFKDVLAYAPPPPTLSVEGSGLLELCPGLPFGNCLRFDDLTTLRVGNPSGPVVPEPGTGLLLALGLLGLGRYASRQRSGATSSR